MNIYMDIETIGTEDQSVIDEIASSIKPPGNIKKAETIATWEAEEKPKAIAEAVAKTSFDGGLGHIICIGYAINDSPAQTITGKESWIISEFFRTVKEAAQVLHQTSITHTLPKFIGHNIVGFDLRFLWQRAVCLNIARPALIPFSAGPWSAAIGDTMLMWNPERERRTSLDKLCRILGVPSPKGELDGSKVWDYYRAGRLDEIADYCRGDVASTRECYQRMI